MSELANSRHEVYAQGLAQGLKQKDAYITAFPKAQKWKDQTVYNHSSELARRPEVIERVKELREGSTSAVVLSIAQRKEWLTDLIMNQDESTMNRLKAVDILNKMDSAYVENVNVNGTINNPLSGMTTEELRELVNNG